MRAQLIPLLLGASLLSTAACGTQRGTGAGVGAVGGGALGYAVGGGTGLLVGAALGAVLGHEIGRAMEENDRRQVVHALETNEPVRWQNPQTGYDYYVEPTGTVMEQGRECREFRMLADIEGRPEQVYGTACRAPDGNWEVLRG
jgi:surface antigen